MTSATGAPPRLAPGWIRTSLLAAVFVLCCALALFVRHDDPTTCSMELVGPPPAPAQPA